MQAQSRAGLLRNSGQTDFLEIVGSLLGCFFVVIIDAAVEIEKLGPGKDGFEFIEDEAVFAHSLVGDLAAGSNGLLVLLRRGARTLLGVVAPISFFALRQRSQLGPQRDRHEWKVATRSGEGFEGGRFTANSRANRFCKLVFRWCRAQEVENARFDRSFHRRKAAFPAKVTRFEDKGVMYAAQARTFAQGHSGHDLRRLQGPKITTQRIALGFWTPCEGDRGSQPNIESHIGSPLGKRRHAVR